MQVRAIRPGHYNHSFMNEGDVFELESVKGLDHEGNPVTRSAEAQFSPRWMEKLDASSFNQAERKQPKKKSMAKSSANEDVI